LALSPHLDLELRDWNHGSACVSQEEASLLALRHAAELLPSLIHEVEQGRSAIMNPARFHL
jgi:hypothetical protein